MDGVMYGTLLAVCASNGFREEAQNYFNQMEEGYSPNLYHYSSLLNAYSYGGNYLKADELMEEIKSSGFACYVEVSSPLVLVPISKYLNLSPVYGCSHSIMISALCQSELFEEAKELLQDFEARTMEDMHGKGYHPEEDNVELISQPAIKKFATVFMKLGNINLTNDVLKVIHSSGYKIDQGLFQMAVSQYFAQPAKKELLPQLLQWMPGQGYVVDSSTGNLILKN
ncbi:hypothetical protein CRYUN_Cryun06bG0042400 [Craigia yunnanensis]